MSLQKLIDTYVGSSLITCLRAFSSHSHDKKIPASLSSPKNACFIKLWAIGDSVVALPAIASFRKIHPKTKISVLVRKRNSTVFERQPFIDEIILLEPSNIFGVIKNLKRFDVIFDLEPYLNLSAILGWWIGKYRIGFAGQYRSHLYNRKIEFSKERHMVETYFLFIRSSFSGAWPTSISRSLIPMQPTAQDRQMIKWFLEKHRFTENEKRKKRQPRAGASERERTTKERIFRQVIGISATISEGVKGRAWPKERFALLADALLAKGYGVVFFGSKKEKREIDQIIRLIPSIESDYIVNAAGMFSMSQTAALMEKCACVVSNDTGPMHVSAAMGTKTIGLFGPNLPSIWAPYGQGKGHAALYHKVWCSPCIDNVKGIFPACCNPDYQECMKKIKIQEVLDTIVNSSEKGPVRAASVKTVSTASASMNAQKTQKTQNIPIKATRQGA